VAQFTSIRSPDAAKYYSTSLKAFEFAALKAFELAH
jgi:hypothetical protein